MTLWEAIHYTERREYLVIDEMQDYTPIQYVALNRMFPCQKIILGDFGQFINPNHLHTLEDLRQLYREAEFVELNKSYRSTYEIITFAKHIQNIVSLEPVKRHGEKPALLRCADEKDEIHQIEKAIRSFEAGGLGSLGIILKTNAAAKAWYDTLSKKHEVNLITPEASCFKGGVSITSKQMSKGLEFDEVLIPQADDRTYTSDYDRSLLYIACTRAMHRLTLTWTGRRSGLLR